MILVTHDEKIARRCQRTLHMEDGRLEHPPLRAAP
jgi:predicted ABC-type transport system involved in lysophospholipase L1 biosynthesis ATPase subunit